MLIYHPENRAVDLYGQMILLSKKEALAMEFLYKAQGDVCSPDDLGVYIYGLDKWYDGVINICAIEAIVSRLRKKLAPYGRNFIETRRGLGWYFSQYEPETLAVDLTPREANLVKFFRTLSPMDQEMVLASQALSASLVDEPTPADPVRVPVRKATPSAGEQPTLFELPIR